jgi:hypothetical protein
MADQNGNGAGADAGTGTGTASGTGAGGGLMSHLLFNKVETGLWLTRLLTVFFGILFILPIFGGDPHSIYQRIFLGAAATSALRLHQRAARPVRLSREFFGSLVLEDSCHYLFYSLIFYHTMAVTLAVIPVVLFALLHSCTFTQSVVDKVGPQALGNFILKIKSHQQQILRFVACSEIFLMPTTVFLAFTGKGGLILPFFYYRFLTLRYASRRNPYCRTVFYELRISLENVCRSPSCPGFLRSLTNKGIAMISRFAPQVNAS